MDGLKRQDRRQLEKEEALAEELMSNEESDPNVTIKSEPVSQKARRSFLDKLTERVKDFLDNAE